MEKQISMLTSENENLKQKNQNNNSDNFNNDSLTNSAKLNHSLSSNINNSSNKKVKKRLSITIVKDKTNKEKTNIDNKKISLKPKEDEKINVINETEEIIKSENEKLKDEISMLKVKYLNMEFENETKIIKYKNIIKNIEQQCKEMGVKFELNFDTI